MNVFQKIDQNRNEPSKMISPTYVNIPLALSLHCVAALRKFSFVQKKKLHKSGKVSNGIRVNIFRSLQKDVAILLSPKTQNKVCSNLTLFPQHDEQG